MREEFEKYKHRTKEYLSGFFCSILMLFNMFMSGKLLNNCPAAWHHIESNLTFVTLIPSVLLITVVSSSCVVAIADNHRETLPL